MNIVSSDGSVSINQLSICDYDLSVTSSNNGTLTENTSSVLLTGTGVINSKIRADIKLSNNPNNILQIDSTGLLALSPDLSFTDETVKVSVNDSVAGYLNTKLKAGTNITFSTEEIEGNESLVINADLDKTIETEDTSSINIFGTGNSGTPLYASVRLSSDDGNTLAIRGNGLYGSPLSQPYKVKVTSSTVEDYLNNLIIIGPDPKGIVTLTKAVQGNQLVLVASIDVPAMCAALQAIGCMCSSPQNLNIV